METKRRRESRYPRRIAGISFGEADYLRIQAICQEHSLPEAQVVRSSVAAGLCIFEAGLKDKIQQFATRHGLATHTVVRGSIEEGLDEFMRVYRSKRRMEQLQQLREELGEDDKDLDLALREYLRKHQELEGLVEEEQFFQKTIDREDELQEEEDRERQKEFDDFVKNKSQKPADQTDSGHA